MRSVADPLLQALDRAPRPVPLFIRDDDAGWDDARLLALLDATARIGIPIDLAVIPEALGERLARQLLRRMSEQPLFVHQHGCRHANHEVEGRQCEFGPARTAEQRAGDLLLGQARLTAAFGERLDPIFTPPWNRCAPDTPAQLARLGVRALSRDAGAPAQATLREIPVHTDWTRQWRRALAAGTPPAEAISADLARHVERGGPIGLMLHHAEMDDEQLQALQALLAAWVPHRQARWRAMRELLDGDLA